MKVKVQILWTSIFGEKAKNIFLSAKGLLNRGLGSLFLYKDSSQMKYYFNQAILTVHLNAWFSPTLEV